MINRGTADATAIELVDRYDPNSFDSSDNIDSEGLFSFTQDELAAGKKYEISQSSLCFQTNFFR